MLARLNNRSGPVPCQFRPLDKQYRTLRRSCKRERQAEVLDTWFRHVTFYCTSHIHTWLNHVPALPLVALVCKIFAKSSIQGCKRKNTCMMRRFSLIIREKGRRIWLRMRNTNNGQTSDFTDFVRAVTRNRDTTWRGLIIIATNYICLYRDKWPTVSSWPLGRQDTHHSRTPDYKTAQQSSYYKQILLYCFNKP